jgi:hypothetical protein
VKLAIQIRGAVGWIMKRWKRCAALAVLVVFVVLAGWRGYPEYAAAREVADREKTRNWLQSLVIPKVDFREASLEEAVASFNRTIAAAPGRPKGLHIEIASAQETAAVFRRRLEPGSPLVPFPAAIGDGQPISVPAVSEESERQKITIEMTGVPMDAALQYLAGLTNRLIETRSRVIRLHNVHGERGTCDPLVTKTFRIAASFESMLRTNETDTETEPAGDLIDVSEFFSASGFNYEGDSFQLNTKNRVLTVRSAQEHIDLLSVTIWSEQTLSEQIMWWVKSLIPTGPSAPPPPTLPNNGMPPSPDIPGL